MKKKSCIALAALFLLLVGCDQNTAGKENNSNTTTDEVSQNPKTPALEQDSNSANAWDFPIERQLEGARLVLHAPQIISWEDYKKAHLLLAVEVHPANNEPTTYATIEVSGDTRVDLESRIVTLSTPTVEKVFILDEAKKSYNEKLQSLVKRSSLEIPLDIFLMSLADDAIEIVNEAEFNIEPPIILVKRSPTTLLYINGDPVLREMPGTAYQAVSNANWPLLRDEEQGAYLLLSKETWLVSQEPGGPWEIADGAPANISKLDPEGPFASFRVSTQRVSDVPAVLFTSEPTELIVIDGEPVLEEIQAAQGLSFVSNTRSPVFNLDKMWYFLTAGRWFQSDQLDSENWVLVEKLPEAFAQIPDDHGMGFVRSSVAGTIESRTAVLEATLPRENSVPINQALELNEDFDGEPRFEPISSTGISRAVNTQYDIIKYQSLYYLCYEGAWYIANAPVGPWTVAYKVPPAVYTIPPSSPSYHVTQVEVASTTTTHVTYTYTSGYSSGIYIAYGIPVYGTGFYYPPYYGYHSWYPRYYSYGHGSYYNPNTGNYANRSVWYGPYGGYSYNQHYSPRTGRSGYVETAWDNDEWASYGETYNPRTDVYSETSRYFNEDNQRFEMERDITRGDQHIETNREVDLDGGWATSSRTTSKGGSAYIESHRQADGSITSEGTIQTGDGRTAQLSQEIKNGQRTTEITGSEGGQLISKGDGQNRGFMAESGEGDLYAGKNGNMYKKDEDGWQQYDHQDGGWQEMGKGLENVDREAAKVQAENRGSTADRGTSSNRSNQMTTDVLQRSNQSYGSGSRDYAQLNRDSQARQRGYQQFNTRRGQGQGFSRSGAGRTRRR